MKRKRACVCSTVALIGAMSAVYTCPARGQDAEAVQRLERQMHEFYRDFQARVPEDQPISERLLLDYGAILRFGFYSIDDSFGETHILRQSEASIYARAELDGAHRFFGRLNFRYNDWNHGDSFDNEGDELDDPLADRFWYQFDLRNAMLAATGERSDFNLNLKGGRQYVHWGSGMTLSSVLYAAILDVEFQKLGVTGLFGRTPSTRIVDFDGSRPRFDDDTDRAFFGAQIEYRGLTAHRPYAFYLAQRDENDDSALFMGGIAPIPTRFDYDSDYVGLGSRGSLGPNLFYRVEGVYEFGEGLSNSFDPTTGLPVMQTEEDIEALAGILTLSYVFKDAWDSRLDLEMIAGSGDDDRLESADTFGGNRPGTDDTSFNALGYVNTGLALAPEPANLLSLRTGFLTSPAIFGRTNPRGLRVGANGFLFFKIDSDAPVSVATTDDTFIGGEVDLLMDWYITSDVNFNLRYGAFFPGDAMPSGQDDVRHFLYAGVTYAF